MFPANTSEETDRTRTRGCAGLLRQSCFTTARGSRVPPPAAAPRSHSRVVHGALRSVWWMIALRGSCRRRRVLMAGAPSQRAAPTLGHARDALQRARRSTRHRANDARARRRASWPRHHGFWARLTKKEVLRFDISMYISLDSWDLLLGDRGLEVLLGLHHLPPARWSGKDY